jgi:hypothetical protein
MTDVIRKAELARELDLSRARISQMCKIGLPVRTDGKLNRAETVAWVTANVCSLRGGWWGELRKKARGGRQPAPMPEAAIVSGAELSRMVDELPNFNILDDAELEQAQEQAVLKFMNEVRKTGNIESFARVALRFGCTMQQAYAVARWFETFMAFYFTPKDPERDYIRVHEEPDWNRMATEAGTTADPEAWQDWMNRILEEEEPGKVGA